MIKRITKDNYVDSHGTHFGKVAVCICDYCEKQFYRGYFEANKNKHHFCNDKCYRTWINNGNHHRKGKRLNKKHVENLKLAWKNRDGTGNKNPSWKGGRIKNYAGYIKVYEPVLAKDRYKEPYIPEHRLVMEKYLGRKLRKEEVVHHINGKKDDNRVENLMLFKNQKEHTKYENSNI